MQGFLCLIACHAPSSVPRIKAKSITNKNIGVEDLNIQSLLERIKNHTEIKEIIIATNPNIDGETTALYLNKKLKQFNIEITRLAYGLQMGGALDYTDSLTLTKSLQGRHKLGDD